MGWDWFLVLARFGVPWRQGRKVLDRSLGPRATAAYRPLQETKARVLLTRILANPDEWEAHIELSATFISFTSPSVIVPKITACREI
jgi:hypothetical protein